MKYILSCLSLGRSVIRFNRSPPLPLHSLFPRISRDPFRERVDYTTTFEKEDEWMDICMDGWMDRRSGEEGEGGILVESERWVGRELGRGQNAWTWIRSSRVSRKGGGDDVDYREKGAEVFSLFSYIYMYLDGVANVAASGIRVSRQCKADFLRTSRVSS